MLPLGLNCALEFHIPTGGGEVPGQSTTLTTSLSDHQGLKHIPDAVPADPLVLQTFSEPQRLLKGRSRAQQKTLTCHALWENSVCGVCVGGVGMCVRTCMWREVVGVGVSGAGP